MYARNRPPKRAQWEGLREGLRERRWERNGRDEGRDESLKTPLNKGLSLKTWER